MNRIAFNQAAVRRRAFWQRNTPVISTLVASSLALLPIIASSALIPDIAFLVLISWRLLRPEMWAPTIALPLGLFNDLVAGYPIGQSMFVWTSVFIAFEIIDSRMLFRDYWMHWFFAALAIAFAVVADWYIARLMGSSVDIVVLLPQLAAAILVYPIASRLVLALDRWRLAR